MSEIMALRNLDVVYAQALYGLEKALRVDLWAAEYDLLDLATFEADELSNVITEIDELDLLNRLLMENQYSSPRSRGREIIRMHPLNSINDSLRRLEDAQQQIWHLDSLLTSESASPEELREAWQMALLEKNSRNRVFSGCYQYYINGCQNWQT